MNDSIPIVIVDDEKASRDILEKLLLNMSLEKDITILAKCDTLEKAVEIIRTNKVDIVFLDIQMPNHLGLEIANFFETIDFKIIFVTAFDTYATKAFDLNAIDYVLKPINRSRLQIAVEKALNQIEFHQQKEQFQNALESIKTARKRLLISDLSGKRLIDYDDIIALEAKSSYCILHLKSAATILASRNLKYFAKQIGEDQRFFRGHKAWLINIECITKIESNLGDVVLETGVRARLSKSNRKALLQKLSK